MCKFKKITFLINPISKTDQFSVSFLPWPSFLGSAMRIKHPLGLLLFLLVRYQAVTQGENMVPRCQYILNPPTSDSGPYTMTS